MFQVEASSLTRLRFKVVVGTNYSKQESISHDGQLYVTKSCKSNDEKLLESDDAGPAGQSVEYGIITTRNNIIPLFL